MRPGRNVRPACEHLSHRGSTSSVPGVTPTVHRGRLNFHSLLRYRQHAPEASNEVVEDLTRRPAEMTEERSAPSLAP